MAGASLVIPILPVFLSHKGISPSGVGLTISVIFVAMVLIQFPAGYLSDKFGRMPILIFGLGTYAFGAFALLSSPPFSLFLVFRFIQGLGSGSFIVGVNSFVGDVTPIEFRGRAYGVIAGSQMGAVSIGVFVGALIGYKNINEIFALTAVMSLIAVPITFLSTSKKHLLTIPNYATQIKSIYRSRIFIAAVIYNVTFGAIAGMYETVWSPLLFNRGASGFEIGISWFSFGIPYLTLSWQAGKLADKMDRRFLVVSQQIIGGGFAIFYVLLPGVIPLITLGIVEAVLVVPGSPAMQSLLTEATPKEMLGKVQGITMTIYVATQAIFALTSGIFWEINISLPFFFTGFFVIFITPLSIIYLRREKGRLQLKQRS